MKQNIIKSFHVETWVGLQVNDVILVLFFGDKYVYYDFQNAGLFVLTF